MAYEAAEISCARNVRLCRARDEFIQGEATERGGFQTAVLVKLVECKKPSTSTSNGTTILYTFYF
jgi:hypothetical protein